MQSIIPLRKKDDIDNYSSKFNNTSATLCKQNHLGHMGNLWLANQAGGRFKENQ